MKDIAVESETVCFWLVDHSLRSCYKDSVFSKARLRC